MKALISFDLTKMKETIKIGKKTLRTDVCSSFLNILSLDINYIERIIKKTNFNNLDDVKKAYKEVNSIEPLLFIDDFDFIKHLDNFTDSKKVIADYDHSISQLLSLIEYQKENNSNSALINQFSENLRYLKQQRKLYTKITNNLPKYIDTIFSVILNRLNLYKNLIEICYFDKKSEFFKGFSELSPLKKCVFYNNFKFKDANFFNKLPSSNIDFTFEFSSENMQQDFKTAVMKKPELALKLLFDEKISPIYEYDCKTLEQFLQVSFFTCLTQNLNVKKCEHCGRYFIAYQRSDEKYCNRTSPQDKGKTCKQYANFENWKNNINSNEELKLYRRIYMAKQMQTRRNPDNLDLKNTFENWKKEAQSLRNEYVHGKIDKNTFISWLNNNS